MVKIISNATPEDNVSVEDFPTRLRVYANHDTRILRECLNRGIESKYAHLNIPRWKRGDESQILQLILAKESGFLVLEGETECVNPFLDRAKWDEFHRVNAERSRKNTGRQASPVYLDQDSPLAPVTPSNAFPFPGNQTISVEKKFISPSEADFDNDERKKFVQSVCRHDWSTGPHPLLPGPVRWSPVLFCQDCFRDLDLEDCTCPPRD